MARNYKNYIQLTAEMVEALAFHRKRTNIAGNRLLEKCNPPIGLSVTKINNWLQGLTKNVDPNHYNFVLEQWKSLPTVTFIAMDKDLVDLLASYKKKSRTSVSQILEDGEQEIPAGLTVDHVHNWLAGKCKTANKMHLDFVISRWEHYFDDLDKTEKAYQDQIQAVKHDHTQSKKLAKKKEKLQSRLKDRNEERDAAWQNKRKVTSKTKYNPTVTSNYRKSYIPISQELLDLLNFYRSKKLLPSKFLKSVPFQHENPSAGAIAGWLSGKVKTAHPEDLEFVLDTCAMILTGEKKQASTVTTTSKKNPKPSKPPPIAELDRKSSNRTKRKAPNSNKNKPLCPQKAKEIAQRVAGLTKRKASPSDSDERKEIAKRVAKINQRKLEENNGESV